MKLHLPFWSVYLLPLVFFITSYVFITQHGMGATNDSLQYEYAAQSFAKDYSLKVSGEGDYVQWAPLYPILLSFHAENPRLLAKWLHLISACICLVLWIKLFSDFIPNQALTLLFGLFLASSTELMTLYVFVWSEALFMALFAAFTFLLYRTSTGKSHWLWGSLIAVFMLSQRNAGIFLFSGLLASLFLWRKTHFLSLAQLIKIGLMGSISFISWNAYTMLWLNNHPEQFDYPEGFSIWGNMHRTLQSVGTWLFPSFSFSFLLGALALIVIAGIVLQAKKEVFYPKVLLMTLLSYLAVWFIVYTSLPDIQRFTAIVQPIFFFLLGYGLWEMMKKHQGFQQWIILVSYLWLLYPIGRLGFHMYQHYN